MTAEEEFDCTVTDWEYVYGLTRTVADDVRAERFEPDVVVALARGGWFAGRCLCDFLGLDDLTSLKIEHYVGTAAPGDEPEIRYPMPEGSVAGKNVLVVDDIADTGESIDRAEAYVRDRGPDAVRTATLQCLPGCDADPDFVGETLDGWTWVVYPWNFVEDMCDLVSGVMETADTEAFTADDLRGLLDTNHGIGRIALDVAQPGRFGEVLAEMERRGLIEPVGADTEAWRLA